MMKIQRPLQRVKDLPDFRRDERTGMIVNINKKKHNEHMRKLEAEKSQREEIESIKTDVSEVKSMLQKLLEKVSNG